MSTKTEIADIRKTLDAMIRPGQVVELRILNIKGQNKKRTDSGYFDDMQKLASAAQGYNHRAALYITPNPVDPALLSRAANRVEEWSDVTTTDTQITRRHWLLIDADPKRASGISATAAEHEAALQRMKDLIAYLTGRGWPAPIFADSGNGAHANYCIDLPNDAASTQLIRHCLMALDLQFSDETVSIDTGNFNAARIWKLYGTKAIKGDDTKERPHRWAEILDKPDRLRCVTVEQLQALAALVPTESDKPKQRKSGQPIDVPTYMAEHGMTGKKKPWNGGTVWVLDVCPFNADHTDHSAYIGQLANGATFFRCYHNSCQGKDWHALKALHGNKQPAHKPHADQDSEPTTGQGARSEAYPRIFVDNRQLSDIVTDAMNALTAALDPVKPLIYRHGGKLCRLTIDEQGLYSVQPIHVGGMRKILSDVAEWVTHGKGGPSKEALEEGETENIVNVYPPDAVVTAILDGGEWPTIPALDSIVGAPIFARDGTLITAAGYSSKTRTYNTGARRVGDITPSQARCEWARTLLLDEFLGDFPFADDASRAHLVGYLLLPFVRRMITSATPLHLATSPKQGSGKGLALRLAAQVFLGRTISATPEAKDDDEWRKRLTTLFGTGRSHAVFDNIKNGLSNAALATALTEPTWNERTLGSHGEVNLPINTVFAATGTNVALDVDIARRLVLIRLDAGVARPWERNDFRIEDIESWTTEHQDELMTAALILINAWIAEGKPAFTQRTKGSYVSWVRIIGGILEANGIPGFLENENAVFEAVTDGSNAMPGFVAAWFNKHQTNAASMNDLFVLASHSDSDEENAKLGYQGLLDDQLGSGNRQSRKTRLGAILTKYTDQVIDGFKIVYDSKPQNVKHYRLTVANPPKRLTLVNPRLTLAQPEKKQNTPMPVNPVNPVNPFSDTDFSDSNSNGRANQTVLDEPHSTDSAGYPQNGLTGLTGLTAPEKNARPNGLTDPAQGLTEAPEGLTEIDPAQWVRPIHNVDLWHIGIEQALLDPQPIVREAAQDLLRWLKGEISDNLRPAACIHLVDPQLRYHLNGAEPPQED